MNKFLAQVKKFDWWLIFGIFGLTSIGLLSIYSSSMANRDFSAFNKQLIFFGISLIAMFAISLFDYRGIRENSYFILSLYILFNFLLIGLLFFAPSIRGVKSWYKLGPLSFDPADFTKLVLVVILAKYFSHRHIEMYKLKHVILSGIYMLIPVGLILLQPNMGSALIFMAIWFSVLLVSGIKFKHFIILLFIILILAGLAWSFVLKDYQRERIISVIYPEYEPLGTGWNQRQAKIAIGNGGFWGQGFGYGSQTQYGFVPEVKADFIFSAIAEEFGFATIILMLGFFGIVFWRLTKTAFLARDNFSRLFCLGLGIWFLIQLVINIGSNIGFLPVIGVPMPLVSSGGSALLSAYMGLGIYQSIKKSMIS